MPFPAISNLHVHNIFNLVSLCDMDRGLLDRLSSSFSIEQLVISGMKPVLDHARLCNAKVTHVCRFGKSWPL